MDIHITEWALNSYLELKAKNIFTEKEFWETLRPDVLRLKDYPNDQKFLQNKFWSPANDINGRVIPDGYKMKWRQIGNGLVQLRLTVGILGGEIYVSEAYVKTDEKSDRRYLAKFKVYLELIRQGRFIKRGVI